jgi:xanthine dehydrogenase accessory factor
VDAAVLADAARLTEARTPFVLATVVWRRGPSSGQQGSKAVILGDGTIRGWLGGACAEPTVLAEARAALESGEPRLLFLGQPDELDERSHDGMVSVAMACENEGAMEVYLEPMRPPPKVVAMGRSPAVQALVAMARDLGWPAVAIDEPDLSGVAVDAGTAVVVATQGHYDDQALQAALASEAGYVGLVASRKRAHFVFEYLRADGVGDDALARLQAPAGIDLGPVDHTEIAFCVLAELVRRRAAGELVVEAAIAEPVTVVDPVCGMTVEPATSHYHSTVDGRDFWFCAPGCKSAFDAEPSRFADR